VICLYNFENKHFIFKQSDGKLWNFFYDNKLGLCYCTLTTRNTWTEPVIIQKNVQPAFFADIDNEDTFHVVKHALENARCPVVIDADGINVLKDNLSLIKDRPNKVILTPHLGEMSRITGLGIDYIQQNRIEVSKNFAKEYGVILILKGYNTIITDGDITAINPTGNSSMASGGMGDCLTGIIASFIGQEYKPMEAACLAAYIHGYAGDRLSEDMFCVNASHVLENMPYVIKELQA
jgi:NAD(P)H-hydrate epimerase